MTRQIHPNPSTSRTCLLLIILLGFIASPTDGLPPINTRSRLFARRVGVGANTGGIDNNGITTLSKNTGALVGIVIGSLVVILGGATAIYFWRKRKLRKSKLEDQQKESDSKTRSLITAPNDDTYRAEAEYIPYPENIHWVAPYPEDDDQWIGGARRSPDLENVHWAGSYSLHPEEVQWIVGSSSPSHEGAWLIPGGDGRQSVMSPRVDYGYQGSYLHP